MKILLEHLKRNLEVLQKTSELAGLATHKTNIGLGREAIISTFLEQNLPSFIQFHTGELFDSKSSRSGQIDIIIHPMTSPKLNLNGTINLFPVETVMACIEVKSKLSTGDKGSLKDALWSCFQAKSLLNVEGNKRRSIKYYNGSVPFIIIGYNHVKPDTLLDSIEELSTKSSSDDSKVFYAYLPELIVMLGSGKSGTDIKPYYLYKKDNWYNVHDSVKDIYKRSKPDQEVLLGPFVFLNRLIEQWISNPKDNYFPMTNYTKDIKQIDIFGPLV